MYEILAAVGVPTLVYRPDEKTVIWCSPRLTQIAGPIVSLDGWKVVSPKSGDGLHDRLRDADETPFDVWVAADAGPIGFELTASGFDDVVIVTLRSLDSNETAIPIHRPADLFMRLSAAGEVLMCSGTCFGETSDHAVGASLHEIVPAPYRAEIDRRLQQVRRSRESSTESLTTEHDGEILDVVNRITPVVEDDEVTGFLFESWDAGPFDSTEALKATERQYRRLIENSLDLVGIFEPTAGRVRFVSPNSTEFIGRIPEQVLGRPIFDFIDPEDHELVKTRLALLADRESLEETLEASVVHADGTRRRLEARARLLSPGTADGLVIMNARDVTARHESQLLRRSLMRADKLAAIGQIAASVAHEVNNPASFITTNLHVMREDLELLAARLRRARRIVDEVAPARAAELDLAHDSMSIDDALIEMDEMLETNLVGMERIGHIVRELRGFSREDDEQLEFFDIVETARAACKMVRNQIEYVARLVQEYPAELPPVYGDRGQLSQVLVNLLVNAGHAIEVAGPARPHEVTVRADLDDDGVRVDVIDTGDGVAESVREQIFNPFFTTKSDDQGTGLGLWLCHEIIENCGGRLWLEETGPQGSRFSFWLPAQPLMKLPESPLEEFSSSVFETAGGASVLVVDDDEFVLEAYLQILGADHDVTVAKGGEEALTLLSTDQTWDVILSDVVMPKVDGTDILDFIVRRRPELESRTFFCTAGVFNERTRRFAERVTDRLLHKPVSPRQLRGLVATVAGK